MTAYTPVVQIKTVSNRLVLEYAFAAYRVNRGYVKEAGLDGAVYSNRTIVEYSVKNWINDNHTGSALIHWTPNDFNSPEITDEDRQGADQVDEHFKKYMFNSLAGKLNQFENDVYSAICGDEVAITRVVLIAYVPELIIRDRSKWQFEKTVKTEYKNSSFQEIENIEAVMTVLRAYDFQTHDYEKVRSVILGYNSNLYQFYDKKRAVDLGSEGKKYHINARIKGQSNEKSTGATITRLNYVKVKPCQNQ
jgi:hypothetical protein